MSSGKGIATLVAVIGLLAWVQLRSAGISGGSAGSGPGTADLATATGTLDISTQSNLGTTNAGGVCVVTGDNIDCKATYMAAPCIFTNPVTGHSGVCQWKFPQGVTMVRLSCHTVGASSTATIQLDERAEAAPATGGTDVATSQLVCDTDTQATTSFSNASIAANAIMNLDIDAIANAPTSLAVWPEYAYQ